MSLHWVHLQDALGSDKIKRQQENWFNKEDNCYLNKRENKNKNPYLVKCVCKLDRLKMRIMQK